MYQNAYKRHLHNNYNCEKGRYCNNSLFCCEVKAVRIAAIVCGSSMVLCVHLFRCLACSVQTYEMYYDEVQE
jgi:hypothetical protein